MKAAVLVVLLAFGASAQTMLDQEQRLIEIHSLLTALPPDVPGAYDPWQVGVGLEIITIPHIDGTTGGREQITASARTPVFPRPRLQVGLPAPADFRAWAGFAYIPPIQINEVSSHLGALEAGFAWDGRGPFSTGLRAFGVVAHSQSPVTDPTTRDTLDSVLLGGDISAAYRFDFGGGQLTPFAGVGLTHVAGDFHVTSDNAVVTSRSTLFGFDAGARMTFGFGVAAIVEWVVYPDRLTHPIFSVSWVSKGGDRNAR
jgi:hypothetical protein